MQWAYGVTAVHTRKEDLLPRTLASLAKGGFDNPHLFVDGCEDPKSYAHFGLQVTNRWPTVRTYGNWFLGMLELHIRNPKADRYAMFQDDFICCQNIRQYLELSGMPTDGYLNLLLHPNNRDIVANVHNNKIGWFESNQYGRGAVTLIFTQELLVELFSTREWILRPKDEMGYQRIDGGFAQCLTRAHKGKYVEYCHNPGLVYHTGVVTSIQDSASGRKHAQQAESQRFRGEDFDAMLLLEERKIHVPEPIQVLTDPPPQKTIQELQQFKETSAGGGLTAELPSTSSAPPAINTPILNSLPLGDMVKKGLDMIGVSQQRVETWLGRPCNGCAERQRRLNRLGWWLEQIVKHGRVTEAKERFEGMLEQ